MAAEGGLRAVLLPGIDDLPQQQWDACAPGKAEAWAYLKACGGRVAAVLDDAGMVLVAPLFDMEYRLDTPFQDGRAATIASTLTRLLPGLMVWRMLGVGSALTEHCPIALRPDLTADVRAQALRLFHDLLENEARRQRARLIAFKDVAAPASDWLSPLLASVGYSKMTSLPVAVLDLKDAATPDAYLSRLSSATRKDIRRKLRGAAAVRIEHRTEAGELLPRIEQLYESTRNHSDLSYGAFEDLPAGYFHDIPAVLGPKARFILYWVGERLAAFNLLLLDDDRVIDKFLGMEYPLARDHNLYAISWMENVRFTLASGRRLLQSGQTAYASKLRFGSGLMACVNLVRARGFILNFLLRRATPYLGFDRWDPELRDRAVGGEP